LKKNYLIPNGIHLQIINTIGRWQVITFKALLEILHPDIFEWNLRKKIKKLESFGYIDSTNFGMKQKHYFLSPLGVKFSTYPYVYEINNEQLAHDVTVGTFLRSIAKLPYFYDEELCYSSFEKGIEPDGVVTCEKNGSDFKLGIEIELTRKSSNRVSSKFQDYSRHPHFDFCLYATNKMNLFSAYRKILLRMKDEYQKKIILMYLTTLTPDKVEFDNPLTFHKGEERSFDQLFGSKNDPITVQLNPEEYSPAGNH
jgi:hypothetical protein